MGFFSRKKKAKSEVESASGEELTAKNSASATSADVQSTEETSQDSGQAKAVLDGPRDISQVEDTSDLVDFGAVFIPPLVGLQIIPEFSADNTQINALTLQFGKAAVQLMVSSAPKSMGLWKEFRGELLADLTRQGATAEQREGLFGTEVYAQVPAAGPDGRRGHIQMRFAGIDGPNWFMRLVFNQAGPDGGQDQKQLNQVVQQLVVYRDATPRPPREVLPLKLPKIPGEDSETAEV